MKPAPVGVKVDGFSRCIGLSLNALAQDYPETGWKTKVRPLLEKVLGEQGTSSLIGEA